MRTSRAGATPSGGRGRAVAGALVACALALLVGAWLPVWRARPAAAPPPPPPPAPTTTTTTPPSPVPAVTTIATVTGPVPYAGRPGGPGIGTIPVGSWWGTTKHLPVIDRAPGWLRVRLPQRPNGLTGWIHASDAQLSRTTYGILVDVTTRRLELWDDGRPLADLPAGVGTADDPTPLGQYYVMDVAPPEGPGWGPFILDTNAHSEAIQSWEGSGDAFTSIHGPLGMDAAIGTTGAAISHGCVRLHDADLARLAPVPPGAPVVIVA